MSAWRQEWTDNERESERHVSTRGKNVLGISSYYRDSAATLLQDGAIKAAAQEERFTRRKHDPRFPRHAIEYCLREAHVTLSDVDQVVFCDKPFVKFERPRSCACLGSVFPWFLVRAFPVWPWIVMLVLAVWSLAAPLSLRHVYRLWMRFGLLMSRVTTPIILGIVFFVDADGIVTTSIWRRCNGSEVQ